MRLPHLRKAGDVDGKKELSPEKQPTPQVEKEVFRAAQPPEGDCPRQDAADGRALRGDAQACGTPAQLVGHARAQPLRNDRAAARLLSQAQAVAHRAAGSRLERADSGSAEIELVR